MTKKKFKCLEPVSSFTRLIQMQRASEGQGKKPGEAGMKRRQAQRESFVLSANETYKENHYQVSHGDNLP